jgi:hypothetical protein
MARAFAALLLLFVLAHAGCTDGNAPPQLVSDAGSDVGVPLDLSGACTTTCDCPAGEACRMGKCEALMAPVFCCMSSTCTGSAICEFSNGTVSQCDHRDAGSITPVIDGGTPPSQCEMQSCTKGTGGDLFCRLACGGSATCVATGGKQHCMP